VTLDVRLRHPLGRITIDADFRAEGGLTALLGPSGAGKTSVLNAIAGLLRPDDGRIVVDGDVLLDTAAGVAVPPARRRIGYMFQEPRLFPHLNVRHNLLYGRRFARSRPSGTIAEADVVALLGLGALLGRSPGQLSGGEKQRVALGRALLSGPRLLLLDEPLASVDARRKDEILPYLDRLRAELSLPTVYVTHNVDEVLSRADRVLHMDEGVVRPATVAAP
jgi:molybdate transport system ATP-binding protein